MCQDCGCLEAHQTKIDGLPLMDSEHEGIQHFAGSGKEISIKQNILHKNNHIAQHNRKHFAKQGVFCMNWISAPGSGKTALLEKMIEDVSTQLPMAVIEGDQQTNNDANRIRQVGGKAVQINTGAACHLDAQMVHQALHKLDLSSEKIVVIENVGNMVCPTAYDLGEHLKVAIISCTEGEDKPLKYPDLLLTSKVLLINKIDLLPYLDFDLEKCIQWAKQTHPALSIFPVSAKTGEGLPAFYEHLSTLLKIT